MGSETVQLRILKKMLHLTLCSHHCPEPDFAENREESQITEPLCTDDTALELEAQNAQCTPYAPGTHKSTRENFGKPAKSFSDFYM